MELAAGKLKVSGAALLAFAAAYFFDSCGVFLPALAAVLVHEAGHFAALKACHSRITELKLELWGVTMRCDSRMSYKAEVVTAAAGPLASLLLALISALAGRQFHWQGGYLTAGISLVFFAFNALPALPLDGGKVIYAVTALRAGFEKAERLACVMSCTVILALLGAGTALFLKTKVNFTLLLAALWLLIGYCKRSGISIKSKRKMMEVNNG